MTDKQLQLHNINVEFPGLLAVKDASFSLEKGRIGCLLGPSGCGKTTLLRVIAGFQTPTTGSVELERQTISAPQHNLAPEKRRIGMVFQDFALFPHLNVMDNIAFGLRKQNKQARNQRVAKLLSLVGLIDTARRYPHQLSGGQQQRIALARALAPEPEILLLDEPFSSLDTELREQLARDVRGILKQLGTSAILVTHDQMEAFAMADEIGVMHHGRICQWDSAYNIYHQPADRFVADFIGQGVMLRGRMLEHHQVETTIGILPSWQKQVLPVGSEVEVLIRPDDILHDDSSPLRAAITEKLFRGSEYLYNLQISSSEYLLCLAPSHHNHKKGEAIGFRLAVEKVPVFPVGK